MTDREKLIDLINESRVRRDNDGYALSTSGQIADHLIANGVTIPVNCRDCKKSSRTSTGKYLCDRRAHVKNGLKFGSTLTLPDYSCSYGERKDDGARGNGIPAYPQDDKRESGLLEDD